jgi:hypothetical protein
VIKLIEKNPSKYFALRPECKHFQFVIVLIDESKPDEVSELQGKVVDICLRHWMVRA